MKLSRIAVGSAVTLSLVGGSLLAVPDAAAQCVDPRTGEPAVAVMISGGTVTNETVIDITADAGTSIADASAGNNNLATTGGGGNGGDGSVTDIASAGNGGVATASANGGAISIQDINSGGNVGNAIEVGDTVCAPFEPAPEKPGKAPDKPVVALPDTGVGAIGFGDPAALLSLLGAAGAAVTSLRLRRS